MGIPIKHSDFFKALNAIADINDNVFSTYEYLIKKNPDFLFLSDKDILNAYAKWFKKTGYGIDKQDKANILKCILFTRDYVVSNKRIPENTFINSTFCNDKITLFDKDNNSVMIDLMKNETFEELIKRWNIIHSSKFKLTLFAPICPVCGYNMSRNGQYAYCYTCHTNVSFDLIYKQGIKLVSQQYMKKH